MGEPINGVGEGVQASQWRIVAAVAAVFSFRVFGFMAVLPLLMVHGQQYAQATPVLLGLAIGAYGLAQAAMNMVMGAWSDRIGRKPIIYIGLSLLVVGSLIAAGSTSVYGLIAGRALQGCGAIGSTLMALLADVVPSTFRGRAMACVGAGIGGSFWLSMVLGPMLFAWYGLANLFLITAVLAGVAGAVTWFGLPAIAPVVTDQPPWWQSCWQVVRQNNLLRCDIGVASLHAVFTLCMAFLPELLKHGHAFPAGQMWQLYVPALIGGLVISVPIIIVAERRHGVAAALRFGTGLLAGACLLWAFNAQQWHWVVLGVVVFFAGFNLLEALLMATVSRFAAAGERGVVMGVYSTSQFFGIFAGGALGGLFRETFTLSGVFLLGFALVLVGGLCLYGLAMPALPQAVSE